MSTPLSLLEQKGQIRRVTADLVPGKVPERQLYVTGEFDRWANGLVGMQQKGAMLAPDAQLESLVSLYVGGGKVVTFLHWIMPRGQGCISLQAGILRLVGWVPSPQVLVLCDGALADESHAGGSKNKNVLARSVKVQRKSLGVTDYCAGEISELFRWQG